MNNKISDLLINSCIKKGCSFVETYLINYNNIVIGYEHNEKINKNINDKYIVTNIIYDNKYASITISCDDERNLHSLIDNITNIVIELAVEPINKNFININYLTKNNIIDWQYENNSINTNEYIIWLNKYYEEIKKEFKCYVISFLYNYETEYILYQNSTEVNDMYINRNSKIQGLFDIKTTYGNVPLTLGLNNVSYGSNILKSLEYNNFKFKITAIANNEINKLQGKIKFSQYAAYQLIHMLIQSLKGDIIVSGKSFVNDNNINEQLFSDNFNLIEDPMNENSINKIMFDFEGNRTSKRYLIRNGKLENVPSARYLHKRLNGYLFGNAYRKYPDYTLKILNTNLIVDIQNEMSYDYFIDAKEFNVNSFYDLSNGNIRGIVFGCFKDIQKPTIFFIEDNIRNIFSNINKVSENNWINTVYTPEFITKL
ncbi:metallopeptidase TldD-related protein [Caldicellulosiruptoraceae bacterium PP1]